MSFVNIVNIFLYIKNEPLLKVVCLNARSVKKATETGQAVFQGQSVNKSPSNYLLSTFVRIPWRGHYFGQQKHKV